MGAIAEAMVRFAQPLIDATDGSPEQLQRAFMLGQMCWNLAVTPVERRDAFLAHLQPVLKMEDNELQEFKRTVVNPMMLRHRELFPSMNRVGAMAPSRIVPNHEIASPTPRRPVKKFAGTGRNEPCPCGSGKKYKLCCGR